MRRGSGANPLRRSSPRRPAPPQPIVIAIQEEYITLGQLLKMAGVIGTGGEAKFYLAENAVLVNGETEQRRGKKLRPGDTIALQGHPPIVLKAGVNEKETD